jgi:hypothetical protein
MRRTRIGALVLLAAVAVAGTIIAQGPGPRASAQSGDAAVVRVAGPATPIKKGDLRVPFEVTIDNVKNLGSFQFELTYSATVFELVDPEKDAEKGDFLGSNGRPVVCNPPISDAGAGVARFTCVTLGPTPKGVNGGGKIATMYLHAKGSGSTEVKLERVKLAGVGDPTAPPTDPKALPILPFTVENTTVSVAGSSGMNWLIWGPVIVIAIIAVAGGGFAAMRMRAGGAGAAEAA